MEGEKGFSISQWMAYWEQTLKKEKEKKTEAGGKLTMLRPVGQREPVSQKIKAVR